jgi:hypothetical protein
MLIHRKPTRGAWEQYTSSVVIRSPRRDRSFGITSRGGSDEYHRSKVHMKRSRAIRCQIALLFLVSISAGASKLVFAESTDALLTQFITTLNASMPPHDNPPAVADLFEPNATVRYMNPGVRDQKGRTAIRNYFASYNEWFSDWTHIERSRLIEGSRAVYPNSSPPRSLGGPRLHQRNNDDKPKTCPPHHASPRGFWVAWN